MREETRKNVRERKEGGREGRNAKRKIEWSKVGEETTVQGKVGQDGTR